MRPQVVGVAQVPPRLTMRQRLLQALSKLLGLIGEKQLASQAHNLSQSRDAVSSEFYSQLTRLQGLLEQADTPRHPAGQTRTTSRRDAAKNIPPQIGLFPEDTTYRYRGPGMVVHGQDSSEKPEYWARIADDLTGQIVEQRRKIADLAPKVEAANRKRDAALSSFSPGRQKLIRDYVDSEFSLGLLELGIRNGERKRSELWESLDGYDKAALRGQPGEESREHVPSSKAREFLQMEQSLTEAKAEREKFYAQRDALTPQERSAAADWRRSDEAAKSMAARQDRAQTDLGVLLSDHSNAMQKVQSLRHSTVQRQPQTVSSSATSGPAAQNPERVRRPLTRPGTPPIRGAGARAHTAPTRAA